jgi:hypothetical protein
MGVKVENKDISIEQITIRELDSNILEFCGWCDGYTAGAKLDEEPYIFIKVKGHLFEYQKLLQTQQEVQND